MKKYENAYVDFEDDSLDLWTFFKRGFKVALLVMSLFSLVADLNLDITIFATEAQIIDTPDLNLLIFNSGVSTQIVNLLAPIALGIWSIGWVLEDAGLMHYKLSSTDSRGFFEIEPAYMRYSAIIEGYSGISTILFYIGAVNIAIANGNWGDIFYTTGMGIFVIFTCGLGYYFYWKITRPFMMKKLRKGLKEVDKMTEVKLKD